MILCIVGPTGVGKTKLSIELAKKYNAIIINADSMQVYKELNIGTAKIKEEEKCGIKHLLFDIVEPEDLYTVYDYQKDLRKILKEYNDRNIIIVGGTGLYIKAGLYNYVFESDSNNEDFSNLSNDDLYKLVLKKDSNSDIHKNNRKRMIRFLNRKQSIKDKDTLLYKCTFIGLTTDRNILYENINNRVDKMMEDGLLEEVKGLYKKNIRSKAVMTGIGYKELYDYLDGKTSLEDAIELIKLRSRKYAKRQYTWFNNQMDVKWFDVDFLDFNKTIKKVEKHIGDINGENS